MQASFFQDYSLPKQANVYSHYALTTAVRRTGCLTILRACMDNVEFSKLIKGYNSV
jgi:hypothetical protein